jgi:hypothetical protein
MDQRKSQQQVKFGAYAKSLVKKYVPSIVTKQLTTLTMPHHDQKNAALMYHMPLQ